MSGVSNFTYLTSSPERRGLEKRDAGKIEYNVAGMQMKIAEIVKLGELPDKEEGAKASYKSYNTTNKLIHGMNQEAFFAENVQKFDQTREEIGISDKKIIIPSFGTTGQLFSQHFAILRDLRHKIDLLK